MAIAIKQIPTLKKAEAERFNSKAKASSSHAARVDFSEQARITKKILNKAKML